MIRYGSLCRNCTNNKCLDLPETPEALEVECPECDGQGCDACTGQGCFFIDRCPNDFCRGVGEAIGLVDLFYQGLPPVSGGVLDQSGWFVAAARFFHNEQARIKADG